MALRDPVAVYNAASNVEAMLIREALLSVGIEAHSVDDATPVGAWMFGLIPEIHKPQVWVERYETQRARQIIDEFETRAAKQRQASSVAADVSVACEECGKTSQFPASQLGSVESCPHCGAYVDVGDDVGFDDWHEAGESSSF